MENMEEQTKSLSDYLMALRRRKKQILMVMGGILLLGTLVALLLPPVYRSTATILIEEQEIPQDLVRSTITSFADQRIQVIKQQVMTRANLMQIVDKYNLYPDERRRKTSEEILEKMNEDIQLNMVSANVTDRVRGTITVATIAFTLSYGGENPAAVQKVANELVSLYLNENLKSRQQKTAETSSFLNEESIKLGKYIAEIEGKLAAFKAKNVGRLPELQSLNMQMRDRTDSEVMSVDQQISAAEERKFYLEGQLAQIKPDSYMVSAGGERILSSGERLKALQAQYVSLTGIYSPNHPDVVKMRREMDSLKKEIGGDVDSTEQAKQLDKQRADLATMREKYGSDHPDVVKLKKTIAALEEAQKQAAVSTAPKAPPRKPENPAYLTLQAQLESANSTIKTLNAKRNELKAKISSYEARLEQTPQVEREYLDLNRDHQNAVLRYQEIKAKQMQAEVAQQLEKDSKGERFSLIDPPQLPEKPASPNRPAIFLLGLVLSLGGGVAYAGVMESIDTSVRSSRKLSAMTAAPLLAVIPYIENAADKARKQRGKKIAVTIAVVSIAVLLLLIHFFWMPLDVLWYKAMRVLEMYMPDAKSSKG